MPVLDAMAQRYGRRPSEFLGIRDSYHAYCLDQAIFYRMMMEQKSAAEPETEATLDARGFVGKFSGVIGDVK